MASFPAYQKAPRLGRAKVLAPLLALCMALCLALAACAAQPGLSSRQALARAHYNRAMAFSQNRQMDQAVTELEQAVRADPEMYFYYYQLGLLYESQHRPEAARLVFKRGLRVVKEVPERPGYAKTQALADLQAAFNRISAELGY